MEQNKNTEDRALPIGKDAQQIQVVVNRPADDEVTIDLARVFHTMKLKLRLFAWVMVLCLAVGVCTPLLLYQFNRPLLTVSSVVTLDYEVIKTDERTGEVTSGRVDSLTAPDGEELDLNQITSSYVLQNALDGMDLSQPVTLDTLRGNLSILKSLTEESQRRQEVVSGMMEAKNASAYAEAANLERVYKPQFIVRLKNGFGDEDAKKKIELKDDELKVLLDRILSAYNDYLVRTYSDKTLPNDAFSLIDVQELDIPESIVQLDMAVDELYAYCETQSAGIRAYRSWKTGNTLEEYMRALRTLQDADIRYLASVIYANGISLEPEDSLINEQYRLTTAQNQLDEVNENIAATKNLLNSYRNDEILVVSTEGEAMQSATVNTAKYNQLLTQLADYYSTVSSLEEQIANIQTRMEGLRKSGNDMEDVSAELDRVVNACNRLYGRIREHMQEIMDSDFFNLYVRHSMPLGKTAGFLASSAKNMAIGAAVGLVLACGLWFLAALAPEFSIARREEKEGRKA